MNRQKLLTQGYNRIERDDRLLDIFTKDTPAKGVELWDQWTEKEVKIIRFWNNKKTHHSFPRQEIEQALLENEKLEL